MPPEVSNYLKNKGWKPAFSWLDVQPEEHAHSFTVAKATEMDVLSTIREHTQNAIDEGKSFNSFKKELEPELQRLGWWGKDAAGNQLGSPRRLRTIYWANTRTARAAGQWSRIQRVKDTFPYLQYRIGHSENHRLQHVAWNKMVLSADDAFWDTHFPPNGWGCKCWVKQLTRLDVKKTGISKSPKIEHVDFVNKRTGEVWKVPKGIDAGWHTNAGKLRAESLAKFTMDKLPELPAKQATIAFKDLRSTIKGGLVKEYQIWLKPCLEGQKPKGERRIIGALSPALANALTRQGLPPQSGAIGITDKSIAHMLRDIKKARGAALIEEMIKNLPLILLNSKAVLFDTKTQSLVFVEDIQGDNKAKIVTKINYKLKAPKEARKQGKAHIVTNEIITTGRVALHNLKEKHYVLIKGKL